MENREQLRKDIEAIVERVWSTKVKPMIGQKDLMKEAQLNLNEDSGNRRISSSNENVSKVEARVIKEKDDEIKALSEQLKRMELLMKQKVEFRLLEAKAIGQSTCQTGSPSNNINVVVGRVNAPPRRFSNFRKPLSKMFEELRKNNLLQPLEPIPLPDPLPRNFRLNSFCYFHQTVGHHTDRCSRLRHEIQDLIDAGKIPNPESQQLNIQTNPLPYHFVTPSPQNNLFATIDRDLKEKGGNDFCMDCLVKRQRLKYP